MIRTPPKRRALLLALLYLTGGLLVPAVHLAAESAGPPLVIHVEAAGWEGCFGRHPADSCATCRALGSEEGFLATDLLPRCLDVGGDEPLPRYTSAPRTSSEFSSPPARAPPF